MSANIYKYNRIRYFLSNLILIIFITFPNYLHAAVQLGNIEGWVKNSNGKPLIGANIVLPILERGASTNPDGYFFIPRIPAGKIQLTATYIGFQSEILTIRLTRGETLKMNITMKSTALTSDAVIITGSPIASDPMTSPQDISSLCGREKIRIQSVSLGKSLEKLPGIYNISAGAVAGKPVIRGHTGERIRVLSNGIPQEYQQYGERHSPTIDPFNYEKIEIVKGAASLLYGSDAIGGAVNLIPYRLRIGFNDKFDVKGTLISAYESNNRLLTAGTRVNGSIHHFGFNASFIHKSAENFHTPDQAPYSETLESGDPKFTGEIHYSDFDQVSTSLAAGYLTNAGLISANYQYFSNSNHFLLPDGLPIGIISNNHFVSIIGNFPSSSMILKPTFSYQKNQRLAGLPGETRDIIELSPSVNLLLDVFTGKLDILNLSTFGFSGTMGAELKYYHHENAGMVPLQPNGYFLNRSLYLFEEKKYDKLTVNFGIRYETRIQEFYASPDNPLLSQDDKRHYQSLSGAAGSSYALLKNLTAAVNVSRGFRTPSFYNLYVYGNHGGVFAFQIGNPDLINETTLDISSSLRFRNQNIESSATVFQNRIKHYIFLHSALDHPFAPQNQPFVFAHDQADALLSGVEFSLSTNIDKHWILTSGYSKIVSKFTDGPHKGKELPLMPSDRLTCKLKYISDNFLYLASPYFLMSFKYVAQKDAAGSYEPFGQFDDGIGPDIPFGVASTKAYHVFNAGFGFDMKIYQNTINIDIEISNILNQAYRDFLDTYKGYALAPGRSVNLKFNMPFDNM